MRITIGDLIVEFENGETEVAIDVVRRLLAEEPEKPKPKPKPVKKHRIKRVEPALYELSDILKATLDYLVHTDASSGVHINEVATGLDIKPATAQWRLTKLDRLGMVHKMSPKMYRPGASE